jgi:hypothetical protein
MPYVEFSRGTARRPDDAGSRSTFDEGVPAVVLRRP